MVPNAINVSKYISFSYIYYCFNMFYFQGARRTQHAVGMVDVQRRQESASVSKDSLAILVRLANLICTVLHATYVCLPSFSTSYSLFDSPLLLLELF